MIFYGITIAVIVWMVRAGSRLRKRGKARLLQESRETGNEQQETR
jgi:hypothetical protein